MSGEKRLLVIEPRVKLNGDAYRKLEEAGYVIVRGDPSQFKLLDDTLHQSESLLLDCALRGLRMSGVAMGEFASEVVREVLKRRAATSVTRTVREQDKPEPDNSNKKKAKPVPPSTDGGPIPLAASARP